MGGEPWGGFVPYQPDITKALHALQDEVFQRGEYDKPYADISFLDDFDFFSITDEEREELMPQYTLTALRQPLRRVGIGGLRQWLKDLNAASEVHTREELDALTCLSTDGPRSVFDMNEISADPTGGAAVLLPPSELLRLYGTDRPTRERVEQNSGYYDNIRRGHGIYIIVYEEDSPSEIYFAGYSYD